MPERMETRRDDVGQAALDVLRGRRGFYGWWDGIPPDIQDEMVEAMGAAALAALGLDDLDAAAERLWDALAKRGIALDRFATDVVGGWRREFAAVLEAALTATEGKDDGDPA